MADITIGELPALAEMQDDALIPCEYDGAAKSLSGTVLEGYVYNCVEDHVEDIAAIIATGPQGDPGVSPTLSATKSGKITSIYYTDIDHPTSTLLASVSDGQDGAGGDMYKSTYDPEDNGIVADSSKLGGQLPSYYLNQNDKGTASGLATLDEYNRLTPIQNTKVLKAADHNITIKDADLGTVIFATTTCTITIPSTLTNRRDFYVVNYGGGTVTIAAGSGVSLNGVSSGSETLSTQYKVAWVIPYSAPNWVCCKLL